MEHRGRPGPPADDPEAYPTAAEGQEEFDVLEDADVEAEPSDGFPDVEPVHTIPEARQLTRARARDLKSLLVRYGKRHLPPSPPAVEPPPPAPPRVTGSHDLALRYLRAVPVVLGALFVISFVWDFEGVVVSVLGFELAVEGLMRITAVSGLIGFLTNWLAITMLFRPRERRPIFGQGLIPAQRERVIYRLAQAVSTELINEEIIQQKIQESGIIRKYSDLGMEVVRGVVHDPDFRDDLRALVVDYVARVVGSEQVRNRIAEITIEKLEAFAGAGLGGVALRAYRFFREEQLMDQIDAAVTEIPDALDTLLLESDVLLDQLPDRIEARSEDLERWITKLVLGFVGRLDIYQMVLDNMRQYDERKLERLIKTTSNEQLNYIKYLGGVLGFFGGLVIWQPVLALAVFGLVGGALLGLDALLYRPEEVTSDE